MRLKEDSSSWRSSSIQRRDYRHDYGTPEVPKGHPKRKAKKPRKRVDHKHVWVEQGPYVPPWWSRFYDERDADRPRFNIAFKCSVLGCNARTHKRNPRYGYEAYKYRKNKGRD